MFWIALYVIGWFIFRYIDQFSRCLYVEYKKNGIDVQCQVALLNQNQMSFCV